MSRTTTLHVMAPPLETLLMNRCNIKYSLARSIVADGRASLGMSKNEAWTPELEEECVRLFETTFGTSRKPAYLVDTNLALDDTSDDSVHEADNAVDAESPQNGSSQACAVAAKLKNEVSNAKTACRGKKKWIGKYPYQYIIQSDSSEEFPPLFYHEITKEGNVALVFKKEAADGTVKMLLNENEAGDGADTISTEIATTASLETHEEGTSLNPKKKIKAKNLFGWLKRNKRSFG